MKRSGGFSLMEILIVIAILCFLYVMAAENIKDIQTQAKISKATADLKTLQVALTAYLMNNKELPREMDYQYVLLKQDSRILNSDLMDPFGEKMNTAYGYNRSFNGQNFVTFSVGPKKNGRATVGDDGRVLTNGEPIVVTNGYL